MTNAELCRRLLRLTREVVAMSAYVVEGVQNPNYCAASGDDYASVCIADIRQQLDHLEARIGK